MMRKGRKSNLSILLLEAAKSLYGGFSCKSKIKDSKVHECIIKGIKILPFSGVLYLYEDYCHFFEIKK